MSQKRKTLAGPEKLAILKCHLVEKVAISELCDQHGLQPSQIYYWQAQLFEHGAGIFDRKPGRQAKAAVKAEAREIARLEAMVAERDLKLARKNEVISELMEENVRTKKANGEL